MENKEDYKNENISAFAFRTGKSIEKIIVEETKNLQHTNLMLEAKILEFFTIIDKWDFLEDGGFVKEKYMEHFNITSDIEGRI